jgi:thiol-disulfide isomerase/thioredoxin
MKITKIICLLAAAGSIISCKKEIKVDKAFVEDVSKYYAEQTSLSADVEYKIKYFDSDDTTTVKSEVKLIRDTKDTLFGGTVWYTADIDSTYKNVQKYYDNSAGKLYLILNDSSTVTRYDVNKGETFIIDGSTDGDTKNIYFLKPEKLTEALKDSTIITRINDTVVNDIDYALVKINYPDEEETTNMSRRIFINKDTRTIDKITFYCEIKDQHQYNEWNISNTKFNTVKKEDLDRHFKEATAKYKLTDFKPMTEEEMAPLPVGTTAPDFTAKLYKDNKEVKLSDYKGKVVVLDFWYMSCHPCQLAIPHLNKIQEKYKDKIVVLGVNASDTDEKQIAKIPDFIKRTSLNYAIAMISRDVVAQYNVYGFPTLYIIDKNGVVKYAQPGFDEQLEKSLDKVIQGLQ